MFGWTINRRLQRIEALLQTLTDKENTMADSITDLNNAIAAAAAQEQADEKTLSDSLQRIIDDCNELLAAENVDYTQQVQAIQATAARAKAAADAVASAVTAEDAKVNPPGSSDFGKSG